MGGRSGVGLTPRQQLGLTPRQARFVDEYLIDLNATQAAIRAGYSPKTAQVQGSRLLLNVMVRAAIVEGKTERHTKSVMSAVEALERASTIGRLDIRQFYRSVDFCQENAVASRTFRTTISDGVQQSNAVETSCAPAGAMLVCVSN